LCKKKTLVSPVGDSRGRTVCVCVFTGESTEGVFRCEADYWNSTETQTEWRRGRNHSPSILLHLSP